MDTAALLEMLLARPQAFCSENDRRTVTQVALDIVRDADAALRRRVAETLATRGSCPLAWCSWCCSPSLCGQGWPCHAVTADSATTGASPT